MTSPPPSTAPNVNRFTGTVLALVVCVCVVMIGFAGYLKYELDRAEAVLAAPESAAMADQDSFEKLRRSLGYSGFIGSAQSFASAHDVALLPDMKAQLKTATDIINHMPERTPAETRRDLQAIVNMFDVARQKAEKTPADFGPNDLAPLYAALPVIDARVTAAAAVNRLNAEGHLQFWAMLLTFICWASLIIAAAMAVGIYLSLRDRNSTPMRALVQSVKNMAHGDMRSSIWGMERHDMIGELARTFDLARYNFSQLPDMTLISDQGPVRIRFEGNTKSLFEAMMQLISRDSEQVRTQALTLAEAVTTQQGAIDQMSKQVDSLLREIMTRGRDGNQQVKQVLEDITLSARSLQHAQEHAADQLNRIVPFFQERAQGMSEITQITGKQVAQVLNSLTLSERNLKTSAEESAEAIKKLSSSADTLGDRLFGAINLLQASGKVLAETTENTQRRLSEAIAQFNPDATRATQVTGAGAGIPDATVPRLEALIASLETAQQKLQTVLQEQTQAAKAQIDLLTTHSTGLLSQSTTTAQTLSSAADHLREEQAKFDLTVEHISGKLDDIGGRLERQATDAFAKAATPAALPSTEYGMQLTAITGQLAQLSDKISSISQPMASAPLPVDASGVMIEIRTGFETTVRSLAQMREQLTNMVINVQSQIPVIPLTAENFDNSVEWQKVTAQIEATREGLSQLVTQQISRIEARLTNLNNSSEVAPATLPADAQVQMEQQTQILTELVATLGVLDEHMQQLKSDVRAARG